MNSAYLVAYQGKTKITRNFIWGNIIWFEKYGNDVMFRTVDKEQYIVKNINSTKFKEKFNKG